MKHQRGFSKEGTSEQRSEVSEGPSQGQGCGKSSSLHREQQVKALRFCSGTSRGQCDHSGGAEGNGSGEPGRSALGLIRP